MLEDDPFLIIYLSICLSICLPVCVCVCVCVCMCVHPSIYVCLTLFSHCRTGSTLSLCGTPQTTEEFSTWWWMQAKFGFPTFYFITSKLVHPIIRRRKTKKKKTRQLLKGPMKRWWILSICPRYSIRITYKRMGEIPLFDNHNFSIGIQPNAPDQMTQATASSNYCDGFVLK